MSMLLSLFDQISACQNSPVYTCRPRNPPKETYRINRGCRPGQLLEAMQDGEVWGTHRVMEHFGWPKGTALSALQRLHKLGHIEVAGEKRRSSIIIRFYRIRRQS